MSSKPAIVLTGMMMSGKSTVGARLAALLNLPFRDLDEEIATRTGRSVPDWFSDGEPAFRGQEKRVLRKIVQSEGPVVLATGGGALQDDESRSLCLRRGFVVYLEATPATLAARYRPGTGRPLLDSASGLPLTVLEALLAGRRDQYLEAHFTIATDDRDPEALVRDIRDAYIEHCSGRAG